MIRILSKSKSLLYILFFCLCGNLIFGQTSGDYRSNPTTLSGTPSVYSWSDPLNWQYFNGSSWVTATSYPGENTGTGTVTIRDSHTITLSTSITKSFTSLIIGEGTSGQLFVSGDVSIQTTSVVIKPSGILSFGKNVSITFPVNTSFVVNSPGKIYATDTNCSNQTALYIGGAKVSACTGNGGGALSDFDVFNARGGTGATSNSPVCSGNQIVLTAIPPVTASNTSYTYTYQWSGRGIYTSGFVSSATYTISNADFYNHGGVYTVDIKRNDGVISTVTTNVVVNLTPVGGGISLNGQAMTCLNSSTGNMTLSGYVGNVLRWEKRLNNSSTWTSITNTANTYSENPSVAGTWDYRAVVGNAGCQEVNSSSFSMYVNPELTITLANANASICQNSTTATLSYTATTGNPVHYEINFDAAAKSAGIQDSNSDMSGTSGTLSMNVPYSVATGIYNGVVKLITYNPSCSSTRTFAFTLTVNSLATPTTITTQPVAPTATCSGNGTQTLTVVATGSSSLTYQWRKNGSPLIDGSVISGATANKLILTNPTTSDAGSYDVVISGNCASAVYSNPPVAVTVNSLTSITNQPSTATQTICLNGTANAISVIAAGSGLSYKWYSNSTPSNLGGALIATAISSNYTPPTTSVGSIYYYCVVSGTCGSAVTSTVSGEIKITPTVTINAFSPANHSRCQGAGTQTNTTTALNNSSAIVYSLDSVSSTAGNTIVGSTGVVTYVAGWSGTTTITASAAGCNGTATSTFVETITPIVTINAFSPASHTRCQGAGTQTNTTTALNNSSAIVYSLDTASNTAGNTIVGSTGVVTYVAGWSGTTTITASAAGCNGTATTTFVETITPTVTINAFSPASHTRCQGAGTQTNTTTALNNSSAIVYSLDTASSTAGNTIVGSTGVVTYVAGWSGTTTITASAAGCNGTATSTFVETITPTVTINAFSPASHTRCQGAGTQTNTTTALNNSSAIVYSLDTASNTAGNTIVGSTGVVTYVAGWSGTTTITASAAGCNGTATTTFVETITPTVTINAFSPASHTRCQGAGTQTNTTTALNNSSAIVYSLDTASSTAGNTIVGSTGVVTYVAGWSGTTTITASAAGCNGTATTTYIVTTNPSPTLTGASQASPICEGSSATINLTGLVINSTSTVNYTITGDAPQSVTVVADPSGNGNFTTRALTVANDNGRNLQITGITITSSTPNCPANFTQNVTLNVKPDSGGIRLNGGSPFAFDAHTTYCPNTTAVFSIDDTGAGAGNYHWTITTGSGWNLVSGQGSTSITVTTGTSIATISVVADNLGCPSYLRVTPTTIVTDPTQGTKTDVTCAAKGSVVLNNLPSGNRTLESILGGVTTTTSGTGLSATVTNLAAGTYTFKVRNDLGCISSPGLSVTILDVPTATWTGSAWVGGIGPDSTRKIVFAGPYDFAVTSSMDGCSCQVNAGVNVLVKKDAVLKLQNALEIQGVEGVDAGTLTFENTASLIQVNDDAVNTGKINYIRTTSPVVNFDYVYWSSPVADQVLNKFSPASDRYYSYATGAWVAQSGSNMMNPAGKGFIIRVPKLYTTTPQTFEFKGVPNNGIVGIDVETVKSNLIGNPYASALDADEFMDDVRNKDFINSALYFWTHNTKRTLTGSKYVYTSDDYALYNMTGGTGAAPSTDDDGDGIPDGVMPSGEIAAGQAFFVASNVAGKFYFDNSMRLSSSGSNGQFFRPSNTKKAAAKTKNRIWLNLTNDGGAFKQLLVGYIAGASNEVDRLYDGLSLNGNTYIDFYSVIDSKNYAIQGRGLPFDSADVVPLGYKTTIAGTFQISIDNVDGAMTNQAVYLEDKIANSIYDLKSGAYSFTTEIGTFNDRFVLRYTDGSKLGTGDFDTKGKGLIVSVKNSQIKINSFDQTISAVKIYDLKGSLLYEKNKVGINELIVDHLAASSQFMIVMTQLENGKWVSEEIIFHD
ncbi:hypothetical protein [Flavobacterium sp. 5]|uniref:hypothetical protein n=1 Tax=Flavobacterium sp. 5 TaxID=2035199 RepID=UPI000C2BB1D0|nr:hypothetical protein [Flavobacterium sp. 5]PKB16497.1 hypothetical protein CLU82_1635 [Flavobacterium sp. 5]